MFSRLFSRVSRIIVRFIKRLVANQPITPYESIVFNAVRAGAEQFGSGRTALV